MSILWNTLEGGIPKSFWNVSSLLLFVMSNNSFINELPMTFYHLSGVVRYSLEGIDLHMNQINDTLLDFSKHYKKNWIYRQICIRREIQYYLWIITYGAISVDKCNITYGLFTYKSVLVGKFNVTNRLLPTGLYL